MFLISTRSFRCNVNPCAKNAEKFQNSENCENSEVYWFYVAMALISLDALIVIICLLNCLYKQCATKGQNELLEIIEHLRLG